MKHLRLSCLLMAAIVFLCPAMSGASENDAALSELEWTWEENSIAFFEGKASLEGMPEGKSGTYSGGNRKVSDQF